MLYQLVWTPSGALNYREIRNTYEILEEKNKALMDENKQLSQAIIALRDDKRYIEQSIRREMRYVKDNEVIYFFTRDHKP